VPFLAGAGGMGSTRFWIYNLIGSALWACVIVGLGTFFVAYYQTVLAWIQYIILGLVIAAIAYAYFFRREAFDRYIAEKRAEIEESAKPR
jgi:membrane protein DedA with SNARE-associated domain